MNETATADDPESEPLADAGSIADLSRRYPVWLCDVWGVVHDGVRANPATMQALARHRSGGGLVILITNAPRISASVLAQFDSFGVRQDCFDDIVTSGDVTRSLLSRWQGKPIYYIGPDRDLGLIEPGSAQFAALDEAEAVLCTGLVDDETEQPEDYDGLLAEMRRRELVMICANPDKVVRRGKRLAPCAGAVAERYEAIGGTVEMAGKPFAPIYDECLARACTLRGEQVNLDDVLAIGDGLPTDIQGAADFGLAALFVLDGIHAAELQDHGADRLVQSVREKVPGIRLAGAVPQLTWQDARHTVKLGD